ncbi:hypothetical protein, variant [Sphaeroforma arctica JP610]|nr:hypothetical protein, variant [Sphaeroforma arctica JP610]KNC81753.1 hypothetical protein, variant [Sphaeroforma arctica JP610]|eukprot:XP_014155655.1 hypothetical protein, variant [Sphaeroforma arctica JP610]
MLGRLTGHMAELINSKPMVPPLTWHIKYGPLYKTYGLWGKSRVGLGDPVLIKQVLVDDPYSYERPEKPNAQLIFGLGDGLLTAHGEPHARMLSISKPAFAHSKVKLMIPKMQHYARQLGQLWGTLIDRADDGRIMVDVLQHTTLATFDVIMDVGFGAKANAVAREAEKLLGAPLIGYAKEAVKGVDADVDYHREFSTMMKIFKLSWDSLLPHFLRIHVFARDLFRDYFESAAKIDRLVDNVIASKREELARSDTKKDLPVDLLSNLMSGDSGGYEPLSDQELKDQCKQFIFAGHETTAGSLTWTLHLLAEHPDIQQRLRDELRDQNTDDAEVDFEQLESLPMLNAVVKESLRMSTSVPAMPRQAIKDVQLGGYTVPKGTWILINPGVIQLDESTYKDAHKFIPDRFLEWSGPAGKERLMYMPFGAGRKSCIGQRVAVLELKLMLANLMRDFEVGSVPDFQFEPKLRITLKPDPGMMLYIKRAL